jgi:hypothetical protein
MQSYFLQQPISNQTKRKIERESFNNQFHLQNLSKYLAVFAARE